MRFIETEMWINVDEVGIVSEKRRCIVDLNYVGLFYESGDPEGVTLLSIEGATIGTVFMTYSRFKNCFMKHKGMLVNEN